MSAASHSEPTPSLIAQRGGLAPTASVKMHPAEINLTLPKNVLRLPITMNARAVLAEIVSLHAANAGCCDASDAHFAARLTLNKDTVSVAVQLLETLGLVTKVTKLTAGGNYRTLTPNSEAITAKAATNPYPEAASNSRRNFRSGHAGVSGQATPEIPVMQAGVSGYPSPEKPESLTGISGGNIPYNTPVSFHTLNNDAAAAAAPVSEKKRGANFSSVDLPDDALISAPPVAAAPPSKRPVLLRDSALATFSAFAGAWQAAAAANPETYADYLRADLKHYHDALLDWSDANGKKKLDWLAAIRSSIRNDYSKGCLRLTGQTPTAHVFSHSTHSRRPSQASRPRASYQPLSEGIQIGQPLTGSIDDL
jgi:hypothetical protein